MKFVQNLINIRLRPLANNLINATVHLLRPDENRDIFTI